MINDIPPKQTLSGSAIPPAGSAEYDPLPPRADPLGGAHPHALVSVHDPSLHGDGAFPVLKAFQDYLETERQQARKRLVTLTAFFVSLMAIVVGGFIVAFIFLFNRMDKQQSRLDQQQSRLLEAALQERKAPPAPVAPEPPSPAILAAQQATRQIEAVTLNLQTNIGLQLASMGAVANRLDTKVDAQNEEMAKLRESLATMQKENERLRTDLPKLATEAARKIVPPALPPVPTPAAGIATAPRGISETRMATAPALPGYEEAILPMRGRDGEQVILWRAFTPK